MFNGREGGGKEVGSDKMKSVLLLPLINLYGCSHSYYLILGEAIWFPSLCAGPCAVGRVL